jgi:hypothetical protein
MSPTAASKEPSTRLLFPRSRDFPLFANRLARRPIHADTIEHYQKILCTLC